MSFHIRDVAAGEPITADWGNALVAAVRRALRVTAAAPLEARVDDTGVNLSLSAWPRWELCALTTTLSPGGQAQARLQTFNFGGSAWADLTSDEITVHDSIGDKSAPVGRRGWIFYSPVSERWEVVQMQCE